MKIVLRNTLEEDLQFVLQAETYDENKKFIGQWSLLKHKNSLQKSDIKHLIVEETPTKQPVGYIILAGLENPNKSLELMRIVVTEKGKGYGREAIKAVKEYAFKKLNFHRLWLDVRDHNIRAKNLYESCGFKVEGHLRECILSDGNFESLFLLSILKQEFEAS